MEKSALSSSDAYTLAISSYALSLAKSKQLPTVLTKLNAAAKKEGMTNTDLFISVE